MIDRFFLNITGGKRFIIENLKIEDDGRVSYNVSGLEHISSDDYKIVDEFVKNFISESQQ